MKVTDDLLNELGATDNRIVVLNKCDLLEKPLLIKENQILISSKKGQGIERLLNMIKDKLNMN